MGLSEEDMAVEQPEQPARPEEIEMTFEEKKEKATQELREATGIGDTRKFREVVGTNDFGSALDFLAMVEKNRYEHYQDPQWRLDRLQEIGQQMLYVETGMRNTADFRTVLAAGDTEKAEVFLDAVQNIREKEDEDILPHYGDSWREDREKELREAQPNT